MISDIDMDANNEFGKTIFCQTREFVFHFCMNNYTKVVMKFVPRLSLELSDPNLDIISDKSDMDMDNKLWIWEKQNLT